MRFHLRDSVRTVVRTFLFARNPTENMPASETGVHYSSEDLRRRVPIACKRTFWTIL